MYDHSLYRGRKHFCLYCLHVFITEEILKRHIKDCFKSHGKQRIIMPKKYEYVKISSYERKTKLSFLIHADLESSLVPENIENKIQKSLIQANTKNILLVDMNIN